MLIPFETLIKKYGIRPQGVLHVGANTGQELKDYYSNGIKRSVWIEAIPSVYDRLICNLKPYPGSTAILACVSDTDGEEVTFNVSNNTESSSMLELKTHKTAHPEVHYVDAFVTKTVRLDTLLSKNDIQIADYPFLNMDIQGAELKALKGIGDLLQKVKWAYLEVNKDELYEGCALYPEIGMYMLEHGFAVAETAWSGNHGWGDAFFINMNL